MLGGTWSRGTTGHAVAEAVDGGEAPQTISAAQDAFEKASLAVTPVRGLALRLPDSNFFRLRLTIVPPPTLLRPLSY